jgi:tetratricopeptide (TPR) repeat protein
MNIAVQRLFSFSPEGVLMPLRLRRLWIACVVCLGCQNLPGSAERPNHDKPLSQAASAERTSGTEGMGIERAGEEHAPAPVASSERANDDQLWQAGQKAMQAGQPAQAIELYEQTGQKNHLSLAAAYLEKGDDRAACEHLGLFLESHPEHRNARFYYAELLVKLGRHAQARAQFERVIRNEQEEAEPDLTHLLHCHTRMLEIGDALSDDYLFQLHRGIGMFLLARQRALLGDPSGELSVEGLLCKAIASLTRAQALRPREARACWYLHIAWRMLAQPQPARRWLAEARRRSAFSAMTPAEQRDLLVTSMALLEPWPR